MAKQKYIVVHTDGYTIESDFYADYDSAYEAMKDDYDAKTPEDWIEEYEEDSYISDFDAMLYDNGDDVFLWRIIKLPE